MKKPKPGTKAWMKYIRGLRGKKRGKKAKKGAPQVIVTIPKNAQLTVKRKPKNPYLIEVTDNADGTSSKRHKWYSPDYNPNVGSV